MAILKIDESSFEAEVLKAEGPVLADFYADWCGPCKMLRPVLEELAGEKGNIKFVAVNIDDEPDLAEEYDVTSIPCLVLFKDGAEADRSVGFRTKDDLEEFLGE